MFKIARAYVSCLGIGFFKKGGGTLASLAALPFWYALPQVGVSQILYSALLILMFITGVWATRLYESHAQQEDSSHVVIDEWVGMGLSLVLVGSSIPLAIAAFILFRVFDIWKPLGIRYFDDHYLDGWGVMLDDVVAGLYTVLVLGVFSAWIHPFVFPS